MVTGVLLVLNGIKQPLLLNRKSNSLKNTKFQILKILPLFSLKTNACL